MPDKENHINREDDHSKVSLLIERQRQVQKRLEDVEKAQKEMQTMLNKFVGGFAILLGAGVFVGWLFTVGSGLFTYFNK